jgi:hypothetical protein
VSRYSCIVGEVSTYTLQDHLWTQQAHQTRWKLVSVLSSAARIYNSHLYTLNENSLENGNKGPKPVKIRMRCAYHFALFSYGQGTKLYFCKFTAVTDSLGKKARATDLRHFHQLWSNALRTRMNAHSRHKACCRCRCRCSVKASLEVSRRNSQQLQMGRSPSNRLDEVERYGLSHRRNCLKIAPSLLSAEG